MSRSEALIHCGILTVLLRLMSDYEVTLVNDNSMFHTFDMTSLFDAPASNRISQCPSHVFVRPNLLT